MYVCVSDPTAVCSPCGIFLSETRHLIWESFYCKSIVYLHVVYYNISNYSQLLHVQYYQFPFLLSWSPHVDRYLYLYSFRNHTGSNLPFFCCSFTKMVSAFPYIYSDWKYNVTNLPTQKKKQHTCTPVVSCFWTVFCLLAICHLFKKVSLCLNGFVIHSNNLSIHWNRLNIHSVKHCITLHSFRLCSALYFLVFFFDCLNI